MKVVMELNSSELGDLVKSVNKEFTVTGKPLEFQDFAEKLVGHPLEVRGNIINVAGTITEMKTDCYPMLVTLQNSRDNEITFAVDEPARTSLENKADVGLKMSTELILKPKRGNGDFYYDVRLANYKLGE